MILSVAFLLPFLNNSLSEGYTAEAVEKMLADATNEVKEGKIHLHARWSFAWAMKKL